MNKKLYTTDEFGRSVDKYSDRTDFLKRFELPKVSPYQRFFEGWESELVPNRRATKNTVRRKYTGTEYIPNMSSLQKKGVRAVYALLMLLAIGLLIFALSLRTASNYSGIALLSSVVPFAVYSRLLVALQIYLFSGQRLNMNEYSNGARKMAEVSGYAKRAILVPIMVTVVCLYVNAENFTGLELIRMFLLAFSGVAASILGVIENKITYSVVSPLEQSP